MSQLRTPYKYIHILGQVALNDLWFTSDLKSGSVAERLQ